MNKWIITYKEKKKNPCYWKGRTKMLKSPEYQNWSLSARDHGRLCGENGL
jgi:hypothetical protein